jgi:hypothetical protein
MFDNRLIGQNALLNFRTDRSHQSRLENTCSC